MSAVEDLSAMQSASPDPISAAEQLAAMLDLGTVDLTIRGARIVGRGSTASADLYLSDGSTIEFESLRDVGNATRLALEIAACTGATPKLKAPQAIRAVALLRALAEHQAAVTTDDLTIEWCTGYLQDADVLDTSMDDQQSRWGAFHHLSLLDPYAAARQDGKTLGAGTVLRDVDGTRYVRTGWFRDYVRASHDHTASPQQITHRAERVGWQRRGTRGAIKATRPGHTGEMSWSFYIVSPAWEDTL